MPAIAIATPILRVARHTPWRTLLFLTASVVALSASPPAAAQNECGAPVGGVATCAVDPGNFASGVTYNAAGDFTLNFDDAVVVTPTTNPGVTATSNGAVTVNAPNVAITTVGAADGMSVTSGAGGTTIDLGGTIDAPGVGAAGLTVDSTGGAVAVTTAADIFGGDDGVVIGGANTQALLTNSGAIGSATDRAVSSTSADLTIENSGAITGYVELNGAAVNFFNSGTLELRDFTDVNPVDGVPETEAVAVSDFGGAGVFDNAAEGSVVLLNVPGATAWDTTGALLPPIGDVADYDITLEGVEQGQLTGLTNFNNAGAIIMQDALGGGAGPVAGDILVITGGGEGAPALFTSEGGSLMLDTFLDAGGAATSLSDVLMLDATALGAGGATQVFIENAGGPGAQTIEDGILVVDVADPAASATGAFELGQIVIAGPWQYQLFQGGDETTGGDPADGDWYLRSNIAPTVDAYRAYPNSLTRSARIAVGTLQQRLGNRWWRVPEQRTQRTVTDPPPPPPPPMARDFIVYFDWDRSEIRADAAATIHEAAEFAKSGNAARIMVVGHTDTSGPEDYNMGLSERRAQAVSSALQGEGVAAQIIGMEWLGETQPAVDTGDGVREQRNRRATIQVSVPGAPDPSAMQPRTRTVEDVIPATVETQGSGAWARIVGVDGEFQRDDDLGEIDEDMWMVQGGVDFLVSENEDSRLIAGVSLHYLESDTDVSTLDFGDVASLESEGWGVSGSLTWYNQAGAYVDGVISGTWYETDIGDEGAALGSLASDNEAFAWAVSVEGGMRYEFKPNYYWVPQAQLIYTSVDVDRFTDPFGADVNEADSDSLIGRLGVAFEYLNRTTGEGGEVHRMQGYGIFNLLYEFMDSGGAEVSGFEFDDDNEDFWGEFGAGLTYSFNEQWSIYGEGSYRTAWEDFGDSQAIQGSLGVRYNW